jgi:hypothetical protein
MRSLLDICEAALALLVHSLEASADALANTGIVLL